MNAGSSEFMHLAPVGANNGAKDALQEDSMMAGLAGDNSILSDGSSSLVHGGHLLSKPPMGLSRPKGGSHAKKRALGLSEAGKRSASALRARGLQQVLKHNFMSSGRQPTPLLQRRSQGVETPLQRAAELSENASSAELDLSSRDLHLRRGRAELPKDGPPGLRLGSHGPLSEGRGAAGSEDSIGAGLGGFPQMLGRGKSYGTRLHRDSEQKRSDARGLWSGMR